MEEGELEIEKWMRLSRVLTARRKLGRGLGFGF